jgi:tetratricopeptide (TPR) repeat protein
MDLPQAVPFAAGDLAEAEAHLAQARERLQDPAWGPPGPRAILLVEVGLRDEAVRLLEDVSDPEERALIEALLALRGYEDEAAAGALERLLERNPEHTTALRLRGELELRRGDPGAARRTSEEILSLERQSGDAAFLLARAALRTGDAGAAMEWTRRGQRWDPGSADLHATEALVRLHRGELDGARETLDRTLRVDPLHPEARFLYGLVRWRQAGETVLGEVWGHWRLAWAVDPQAGRAAPVS